MKQMLLNFYTILRKAIGRLQSASIFTTVLGRFFLKRAIFREPNCALCRLRLFVRTSVFLLRSSRHWWLILWYWRRKRLCVFNKIILTDIYTFIGKGYKEKWGYGRYSRHIAPSLVLLNPFFQIIVAAFSD